jgi:hypothetical protein
LLKITGERRFLKLPHEEYQNVSGLHRKSNESGR